MVNTPPVSLEGGNAREFVDGPSGLIFCRLALPSTFRGRGNPSPRWKCLISMLSLGRDPRVRGIPPPEMEMFNFHFALWAAPVQGLIYALTPSTGPQRIPRWALVPASQWAILGLIIGAGPFGGWLPFINNIVRQALASHRT